jgi:hypothetical protein
MTPTFGGTHVLGAVTPSLAWLVGWGIFAAVGSLAGEQ